MHLSLKKQDQKKKVGSQTGGVGKMIQFLADSESQEQLEWLLSSSLVFLISEAGVSSSVFVSLVLCSGTQMKGFGNHLM